MDRASQRCGDRGRRAACGRGLRHAGLRPRGTRLRAFLRRMLSRPHCAPSNPARPYGCPASHRDSNAKINNNLDSVNSPLCLSNALLACQQPTQHQGGAFCLVCKSMLSKIRRRRQILPGALLGAQIAFLAPPFSFGAERFDRLRLRKTSPLSRAEPFTLFSSSSFVCCVQCAFLRGFLSLIAPLNPP